MFRRAEHLATVRLDGTQPRAIRASLRRSGLSDSELELLMTVVGEMGP